MNELQLIGLKMSALTEADDRIRELERAGQITLELRDAWLDENRRKRDELANRLEKLNETQGGTTPILTADQAQQLRDAVAKLHEQNVGEAAVRALLQEVLTIAEAASDAETMADDAGAADAPFAATRRQTPEPNDAVVPVLAFAAGVAVGLLLAILARKRD